MCGCCRWRPDPLKTCTSRRRRRRAPSEKCDETLIFGLRFSRGIAREPPTVIYHWNRLDEAVSNPVSPSVPPSLYLRYRWCQVYISAPGARYAVGEDVAATPTMQKQASGVVLGA
jgi:hypothetical protein